MLAQPVTVPVVSQPNLLSRPFALSVDSIHAPIAMQHANTDPIRARQRQQLQVPAPLARLPNLPYMLSQAIFHEPLEILPMRLNPSRRRVSHFLVRLSLHRDFDPRLQPQLSALQLVRDRCIQAVSVRADLVQREVARRELRGHGFALGFARVGRVGGFELGGADGCVLVGGAAGEAGYCAVGLLCTGGGGVVGGVGFGGIDLEGCETGFNGG
jgi:hypothetical protein